MANWMRPMRRKNPGSDCNQLCYDTVFPSIRWKSFRRTRKKLDVSENGSLVTLERRADALSQSVASQRPFASSRWVRVRPPVVA